MIKKQINKFNIILIETKELDEQIEKFIINNGCNPYILMNKNTFESLEKQCIDTDLRVHRYLNMGSQAGYYKHCYIYFDNENFELGEIELR